MLARIAGLAIRRPRWILSGALLVALLAGLLGASVSSHLGAGGFTPTDAESTRASDILANEFHSGEPNLVLLVTADAGIDSPAARSAGERLVAELAKNPDVSAVQSYWGVPPDLAQGLRSKDKSSALVVGHIAGNDTEAPKRAGAIAEQVSGTRDGVTVRTGGIAYGYKEVNDQITKDLQIAEAVAIPLTAIVLIWVFGSLIAALLPLAIGMFSILATLAILRAFTLFTDVSIYALNMATALGLALAIDYSLFIVSRFREELDRGLEPGPAVIRTVQTAGRTVLFSALTVALSLSALAIFPVYFLKSFAYAGLAVVATAAIASILVLPAALMVLGRRVDSLDVRPRLRKLFGLSPRIDRLPEHSFWYRIVSVVMRHAAATSLLVVALLVFLGSPFLSASFGYPDDRSVPDSASSRQVGDTLRFDYAQNAAGAGIAVLPDFRGTPDEIAKYAGDMSRVEAVGSVVSSSGTFVSGMKVASAPPGMARDTGAYLTINSSLDPYSEEASTQLQALRDVPAPSKVLFTGAAAQNHDSLDALGAKLPLAIGLIALATFVVLFLFTGSIVLPLKALLLNTLSLSAMFGAMVWIFQDGHLADVFGFTATGHLIPTMPLLMFCLAFGMSMDYEVFLLSRIREEWLKSDRTTADNTHAVAMGVARTGRIVTAAAGLMAIVFFAMTSSKVSFMQMFGLGLTLTVLADATLVRGILVPSLMRLMGRWNWWAPKPLARLHERIGLEESPDEEPVAAGRS